MKLLDLFSGIGGFSIGLERAGFDTVAFCEFDKKAQLVLKKHWPDTPIYDDVRTLTAKRLRSDGINRIDAICGGFPCQDISLAGKGAGLAGERSGLWYEYHRLIKEIRPAWVFIENVAALRSRGLEDVLRSLDEIGYDAEWHCIPASAVGAPHRRDRVWIVAYSRHGSRGDSISRIFGGNGEREHAASIGTASAIEIARPGTASNVMANAMCKGLEGQRTIASRISQELKNTSYSRGWAIEPDVGRVANGVPNRVDRLKQLGNAVVPQIPELIGRAILEKVNDNLVP